MSKVLQLAALSLVAAIGVVAPSYAGDDLTASGEATFAKHKFALQANKFYQITATGEGFRPIVRSLDKGVVISADSARKNEFVGFVATGKAAEYKFGVTPEVTGPLADGKALKYKVDIKEVDRIEIKGGDVPHEATRMPFQVYPITLKKGQTYTITLDAIDKIDPFLFVQDADDTEVANDDDGGGELNSKLTFTPEEDGVYKVVATTLASPQSLVGKYNLTITQGTRAVKANPGEKTVPGIKTDPELPKGKGAKGKGEGAKGKDVILSEESKIAKNDPEYPNNNRAHKVFKVALKAKTTYVIDMKAKGGDFDPYLYLEDADQEVVEENDDNGDSLDSRITFTPTKDGQYRIIATTYNGIPGSFELTVREQGKAGNAPRKPPVGRD